MKTIFVALLVTSFTLSNASGGGARSLRATGFAKALAEESVGQKRAQAIAAYFNKRKHKVKERYGIRVERYMEVRSEPVIKKEIENYSGEYEAKDAGYVINIRVGKNGKVEASGYEPVWIGAGDRRNFSLKDARIEDALLTATKVYADGSAEKFEGVFINRTELNSPTETGVSRFGLGVIGQRVEIASGVMLDKLFYQLKR